MLRLVLMGGGLVLLNGCDESPECRRARQMDLPDKEQYCGHARGGGGGTGGGHGWGWGGGHSSVARGGFGSVGHAGS